MLRTCERFGCLPSQLYEEDADLIRLLRIEELGKPEEPELPEGGEFE